MHTVYWFNAAAIMLVQAMSLLAGSNPDAREEECKFPRGASNHVYVCLHVAPALLVILMRSIDLSAISIPPQNSGNLSASAFSG